ncbi:MAG TPA: hypothetical protein VI749_04450 [Candidatus Omnitrophota bacterium]|nr:hypothetical protein [Candidatus Omnitrophota bacterium]
MLKKGVTTSVKYSLNHKGAFTIEDYNHSKTFSNFFPGVAGLWGIPMWAFYVNRGQCIASFGIEDKDKAILEFQPANKAYRLTSLQGFRTFIKAHAGGKTFYWEPFQKNLLGTAFKKKQSLAMTAHDLTIEEDNLDLGLKIRVNYFTLPEEPFSALVRQISIKSVEKRKYTIELIDGLPIINAFGLRDGLNKFIARTAEAWIKVRHLERKAPFYQLNVEIADKPEVTHIKEGNFFFSFLTQSGKTSLIDPIVEAPYVFGESTDYSAPERFLDKHFSLPDIQKTDNKTPSAMGYQRFELKPDQEIKVTSFYGYAHDIKELEQIIGKTTRRGYIDEKAKRNKEIIDEIKNFTLTNSSSDAFNFYASHTFLDNVLRGGLPVSIKTGEGSVALNVFSRKHGDLERDYNYFNLAPTFYSQGNGNYRDVNQNRRNDVWFNTDVQEAPIVTFMNMVQADGYNPLVVKGATFSVLNRKKLEQLIHETVKGDGQKKLLKFFTNGFRPGGLLTLISHQKIALSIDHKEFLGKVLEVCHKHESAEHGEGFWSDHWTYNLDLIESYLRLYPDRSRELLLDKKVFSFYHNSHYVLPREERYILNHRGVRQYASVAKIDNDEQLIEKGFVLRGKSGQGAVYTTNLLCKLVCLIANKAASLDPSGIGVEMEADKPNWYDALNGLPGLLGSSLSETVEIKRFSQFLLDALNQLKVSDQTEVALFEELATFLSGLSNLLALEEKPLMYWQKANDIKEHYRQRIRSGIAGKEIPVLMGDIKNFLQLAVKRANKAIELARDEKGHLATYFYHEVSSYEHLDKSQGEEEVRFVRPKAFKKHVLPLFLEGYVHALRASGTKEERLKFYNNVKETDLFDRKLKMYKVTSDLSSQTEEIGRARIFPRGWLENESIWLHMEYKFMLELLRGGLYEEFYENFRNVLIPFHKPQRYGRSILENSSFIVSSVHEDEALHGQGFVARLSGSTAEFLHIWLLMNIGLKPFSVNSKNELNLNFDPVLAGWLFTTKASTAFPKNTYAFQFLGKILVVYHNPKRRDTFGPDKAKIKSIKITYPKRSSVELKTSFISAPYSQDIREQRVDRIDIFFD